MGALVQVKMCVKEIDQWMVKNKLKLNGDKTELLVINAGNPLCPNIKYIEVSISRVQPSTSARNTCQWINTLPTFARTVFSISEK